MANSDNDIRKAGAFDETLDRALAPQPAPAHLRASIMTRIADERDEGVGALFRPRFSLPVAAFALVCLIGGYTAGAQLFDATDDVAADMASAMGYTDTGVVTEELL